MLLLDLKHSGKLCEDLIIHGSNYGFIGRRTAFCCSVSAANSHRCNSRRCGRDAHAASQGRPESDPPTLLSAETTTKLGAPGLTVALTPRFLHKAAAVGTQIYALPGNSPTTSNPIPGNPVEILDTTTMTWSVGPAALSARSQYGATVVGFDIYIAGGYDQDWSDLSSVDVLDTTTGIWRTAAPMPIARADVALVAV